MSKYPNELRKDVSRRKGGAGKADSFLTFELSWSILLFVRQKVLDYYRKYSDFSRVSWDLNISLSLF